LHPERHSAKLIVFVYAMIRGRWHGTVQGTHFTKFFVIAVLQLLPLSEAFVSESTSVETHFRVTVGISGYFPIFNFTITW
jgi:hypothetical protein